MQLILNADTRPIPFMIVQSTDHITGLAGAVPTVTISKNGAAFAAPAGTVAEIGNGWYKLIPTAADTGTNGPLLLHATATGGDPADVDCQVVAMSPYAALPANFAGLAIDGSGGITVGAYESGKDPASYVLGNPANKLATDASGAVGANNLASLLDVALSGHTAAGTPGAALGNLVNALAESYAANGAPATLAQLLYAILAILANVSQSGTTITATKLDGTTTAMSFTLDNATAPMSRKRAA
jgi:hypothetical protein